MIFENLTLEDAKTLAHWYEGQGEQIADIWFECQEKGRSPITNVSREGGFMEIKGDDVIVYLRETNNSRPASDSRI